MAGLSLNKVLEDFPDIEVEKVEYLTHFSAARKDGATIIPALVSGDNKLVGILLSSVKIRAFLESLGD
jgi:hypothetical protein